MVEQGRSTGVSAEGTEEEESEGIDLERIREIGGFVLRSTRRWPKFALTTFVLVAGLGLGVAVVMPRTYSAQVRLLAQRSSAIRMLSSPNPAMDSVDSPTKNIGTMILRRDNLVALVKEANLAQRYYDGRSAPLRLKDRLFARLFGPLSDDTKQRIMVATLEDRLNVEVLPDDATVVIAVDWVNPGVAYDLVTLVQKNFLEARYDNDVAMINDSIAVLDEHAKSELALVDSELETYQALLAERAAQIAAARPKPLEPLAAAGPRPTFAGLPSPDPPSADLTRELEEKRLQVKTFEEARQRTLDSLRQQLMQAQLTLTPMHPTVVALQQQLDTMSQPSPELARLKSEQRSLMLQVAPARATVPLSIQAPSTLATLPLRGMTTADAGSDAASPVLEGDGTLQLAQSKLGQAIHGYQDAIGRIDAAKVELDITRTLYKHRYIVVTPAELPNKPKKATAQRIGVGSMVGAALLAIVLSALADLVGGLILESWQVRRRLKIEVLGELDRPS